MRREADARRPPAPGVPTRSPSSLACPGPSRAFQAIRCSAPGDRGRAVHRPAPAPAAEAKRDPILDQMDGYQRRKGY